MLTFLIFSSDQGKTSTDDEGPHQSAKQYTIHRRHYAVVVVHSFVRSFVATVVVVLVVVVAVVVVVVVVVVVIVMVIVLVIVVVFVIRFPGRATDLSPR